MKNNVNLKTFASLWKDVSEWFFGNVLSLSFLYEVILILSGFIVSALLSRLLRKKIDRTLVTMEKKTGFSAGALRLLKHHLTAALFPLILLLTVPGFRFFKMPTNFIEAVAILSAAWIIVDLASHLIENRIISRYLAITVWISAALSTFGAFDKSVELLSSVSIDVGELKISPYTLIKGLFIFMILFWLAGAFSSAVEKNITKSRNLTPSLQVLSGKLFKVLLYTLALSIGLGSLGIDLTAFAVFSGAVGVGVGFGLQKIVSNIFSGFIILLDDSIKPSDIIQLEDKFGTVNHLGARYISVIAWDGTEHLIPNEEFITSRVINWTHSNKRILILMDIGVSYNSDIKRVSELILDSTKEFERVLTTPAPACLLMGFGDSSVDFRLSFWIDDPENGILNIKSNIYFRIWDLFKENGIEIPFPQRDVHIKEALKCSASISGVESSVTAEKK